MSYENIKGNGTATIDIRSIWDNEYNLYSINNALTKGKHVITRVDVQGAERIRNIM